MTSSINKIYKGFSGVMNDGCSAVYGCEEIVGKVTDVVKPYIRNASKSFNACKTDTKGYCGSVTKVFTEVSTRVQGAWNGTYGCFTKADENGSQFCKSATGFSVYAKTQLESIVNVAKGYLPAMPKIVTDGWDYVTSQMPTAKNFGKGLAYVVVAGTVLAVTGLAVKAMTPKKQKPVNPTYTIVWTVNGK